MPDQLQTEVEIMLANTNVSFFAREHWVIFRYAVVMTIAAVSLFFSRSVDQVLIFITAAIAAGMWLDVLVRYFSFSFIVRGEHLITIQGIFPRKMFFIPLDRVQHCTVTQTLSGKIFNYGRFSIEYISDEGQDEYCVDYVASPKRLKMAIGK